MSTQPTANWWIRTGGNNLNGGGYDAGISGAGTNYADQDAAVLSLTDFATPSGGSTTLTSATGGFTALMKGNAIRLASGTNFQAGYYWITGYTSTTQVTLDRTPSSGAAGSSGTGRVGGAFADFTNVASSAASPAVPVVAGNTVNIRGSGSDNPSSPDYTKTGYYDGLTSGTAADGRVAYIGYNGRPYLQGNGLTFYGGQRSHFQALKFSQTGVASDTAFVAAGTHTTFDDVYWDQNGQDFGFAYGFAEIRNSWLFNTGSTSFGTVAGLRIGNYAGSMFGCTIQDLRYRGVQCPNAGVIVRSVIKGCASDGLHISDGGAPSSFIDGNVLYGNGGNGLLIADGDTIGRGGVITNNIFYGNGGYGISVGSGTAALNDRILRLRPYKNAFRSNTSGAYNALSGSGDITLTADPFINAAGGNFGLNETAGGGALLRGVGFPAVFPGLSTTAYFDVGAVQRESPSDADIAAAVWTYANRTTT